MKTKSTLFSALTILILAISLTGCQSPGRNPAGVRGSSGTIDDFGYQFDDMSSAGIAAEAIPLADRPTGGREYAGMFTPVYFAYDSSHIPPSEREKIEAVAFFLKNDVSKNIIIDGHCDERGSVEYNQNLSEKRALAIRTYLSSLGISSNRIQTRGFGEEVPAATGHNETAWRLNRRGEFVLYY